MAEREVVLDQPEIIDEQAEAVRKATERAERAEAELARLKSKQPGVPDAKSSDAALKTPPTPSTEINTADVEETPDPGLADEGEGSADRHSATPGESGGVEELRKDSMMAHLLDSLDAGKDVGHYGRLVFAMVSRHFLSHDEVLEYLMKDRDFSEEDARLMLRQVEGRDYNPPKRDRILEWQSQQEFPILPNVDDPDCGNLYRNLKFPDEVYRHIGHYQEAKMESGE
jgi:hypothetical protein